jgi:hypothetical protein
VDMQSHKERRFFEFMLVMIVIAMAILFARVGPHRIIVLNLFYVPIILSAYFLGRNSAGVLALFCVLAITVVTGLIPAGLAAFDTPVMVGLALTVWGAVLGMAAILVGTLCDERANTVRELHGAYVGVVEVLSKYLQAGNPRVKARSVRVAELSQAVADELRLSTRQTDDIRVAALLHELGNLEITTQIIGKAVDTVGARDARHTFRGTELVHSLGSVLEGALPLLADQDDALQDYLTSEDHCALRDMPLGARIIRIVRAYDDALSTAIPGAAGAPQQALQQLRADALTEADRRIVEALERATQKAARLPVLAPA